VCLTHCDAEAWHGVVTDWDLISQGTGSYLGLTLSGHYVCMTDPIPGWEPEPHP
jgi:hypothetical protein